MQEVDYKTLSFMCGIAKKLKPKPPLTISEWADKYSGLLRRLELSDIALATAADAMAAVLLV